MGLACVALKLRQNPIGELFAKLDAPLIKRIYIPDASLHKCLVFIECN